MGSYGSGEPLLSVKRNAYAESPRKCRDSLCIVIFSCFWVGMVIVASVGLKQGNPRELIFPSDHTGTTCTKEKPNIFYPHPKEDIARSNSSNPNNIKFYGICVKKCPKEGEIIDEFESQINTTSIFHRCLPSNKSAENIEYKYIFGDASHFLHYMERYVGDIQVSYKPILLIGGLGSLLAGFIYICLLRICPSFIVWISILLTYCIFLLGTIFTCYNAGFINHDKLITLASNYEIEAEEVNQMYYQVAGILFIAFDIIFFLLLLFMYSRISLCIGILKEASRGLSYVPFLFSFPFIPAFLLLTLFGYFVVTSIYIGSCDKITIQQLKTSVGHDNVTQVEPDDVMWILFTYNLFGVLWTLELIEAIMICTVAGAICQYYWSENRNDLGYPVSRALYRTFRYNLGSLIFGSCIIAIVQLIRIILEYIDKQTSGTKNKLLKVVFCCCKICLWCMHTCLKFLNKTGYVIMAMKGTNFCKSITDAFHLITSNALRVATVSIITAFTIMLGKLFIAAGCAAISYYYITYYQNFYEISSPFPPVIISSAIAYTMSYFCLGIFDIAVETILLSVCEDEKINKSTGQYYASASIRNYLDASAAHAFEHHKSTKNVNSSSTGYHGI